MSKKKFTMLISLEFAAFLMIVARVILYLLLGHLLKALPIKYYYNPVPRYLFYSIALMPAILSGVFIAKAMFVIPENREEAKIFSIIDICFGIFIIVFTVLEMFFAIGIPSWTSLGATSSMILAGINLYSAHKNFRLYKKAYYEEPL